MTHRAEWVKDGLYRYKWNTAEREAAKRDARFAADRIQSGPVACYMRAAALGGNEDLLFAVHLIRTVV